MDTKVENAVVMIRNIGKLPEESVSFYTGDKPAIAVADSLRVSYLGYKTDTKKATKRENMAVICRKFDADEFSGVSGHKLLNDLLAETQDSFIKLVADSEMDWDAANDVDKFIAAYNDNSRTSSGRKVTKESLGKLFMDHFAQVVVTRALTKNAQMTEETVAKVVEGYKTMFCNFTKYDIINAFTEPQIGLLKQIIAVGRVTILADSEDAELIAYVDAKIAKREELKTAQDQLVDAI